MHKRLLTLFALMGVAYLATEVTYNAISSKAPSLIGHTSLWMFLVGGLLGVLLGELSPGGHLLPKGTSYPLRVVAGGVAINLVELVSGLLLNRMLGFNLWDYSKAFLNLWGQVCLYHAVLWFLFTPFVYWLDDLMRHYLYDDPRPRPLISYYLPR